MDSDLARRSHAVLMKAVELDEREQEAFVNSACAGDQRLRARVADLLGAIDRSRTFLELPALEKSRAAPTRVRPGGPPSTRKYTIVKTIGVGGMATVYEAIQDQPRRRVALKMLRYGLAQTSAIERFRFETEVLARLQHPGIAQIFEAGAYDDGHGLPIPYFAMEYIADACTITEYAQRRRLSLAERLALLATVCDAVQHGHQHGVIHRDLKPGNILIDSDGKPKVIDFGVARASDPQAASITRDAGQGQLVGTLNYMSPEQCVGGDAIDIRSDVYALGVILYELVCGRLPHDLSRLPVPEALRVIREGVAIRPAAIDPRLRGDVDAIVQKAICKDPDRRYPTVAALADDIRRHLRCESVEARPPTMTYRAARFVRRHRLLISGAAVVLLAILGGAVVSGVFAVQAWRESQRRMGAEQQALAERDAARWQSYVASIAAANASLQTHEYSHARTRLRHAPEEHRGWEWRFLNGQSDTSDQTVAAHEDMIFAFASTRDGTRFVTGCRDGSLRVWDAATGDLLANSEGTPGAAIYSAAFSHDGERIVTGSADHTARVWDAWTGEQLRQLVHAGEVRSVAWGTGNRIASASQDGVGRLWDAGSGEVLRDFHDQPDGVRAVAFSVDGLRLATSGRTGSIWLRNGAGDCLREPLEFGVAAEALVFSPRSDRLAVSGSGGRLLVWNTDTGEVARNLTDPDNPSTVRTLQFSPDGTILAAGYIARTLKVHSLAGDTPPCTLHGHEEAVAGLVFSADGRQLFSASWDRTIRRWKLHSNDRAETDRSLRGHSDGVMAVAYSPDGSILASASRDKSVRLWDAETSEELGTLSGSSARLSAVVFSPDGEWIAAGGDDGAVQFWNARTGASAPALSGHGGIRTLAFSPGGQHIVSAGEDGVIRVWEMATRRNSTELAGHSAAVNDVTFSPDGRRLASASRDRTVRLWNMETGAEIRTLTKHVSDAFAVVFSGDGRRLFSGSRDQFVRVWDVESGTCEHELGGHGQFITSLSLSSDGTRLAAGSWFGELVLWDMARMDQVASLKPSTRAVRSVTFSSDGRWLASGSYDNTVRIFDSWAPDQRTRARADHAARQIAAERLIDRLGGARATPEKLSEALDRHEGIDPATRAAARKLVLVRSLRQGETQ